MNTREEIEQAVDELIKAMLKARKNAGTLDETQFDEIETVTGSSEET